MGRTENRVKYLGLSPIKIDMAYRKALDALLAKRHPDGYWLGELSSSALSTATAVGALSLVQRQSGTNHHDALIAGGLAWLEAHQNPDGGWGDTVKSLSNISTTMLCRAAFKLGGQLGGHLAGAAEPILTKNGDCLAQSRQAGSLSLRRAEGWLAERFGKTPAELAEAVRQRYGKDRTFSVPILTMSALAGLVSWQEVPALPFELACFPQSWFRFLRLHVVSYALPALIAIGQAVYHHRPPRNPMTRLVRRLAREKSLHVLQKIQPASGGFLEAMPLTSFVIMSLAGIGLAEHPVVRKGVEFLVKSARPDGSWPIDANLSTWVTTLAINALAAAGELKKLANLKELADWLCRQQYLERHPYTGADPGGWAWTDLPGGVPDADDTAGAILALTNLERTLPIAVRRCAGGLQWLLALQNRDGGWPTFCRGWGRLPFDRSGSDLTAHVLRALTARIWAYGPPPANTPIQKVIDRGLIFLARQQRPDGSWLPLWFGNQHHADEENPTYGTARVLAVYRDLDLMTTEPARRGLAWLVNNQNPDGGWGSGTGTPSSMEETALAVELLVDAGPDAEPAANNGLAWLVEQLERGGLQTPTPIGFYFANLWYFEKLYPIIFSTAALGKARLRRCGP